MSAEQAESQGTQTQAANQQGAAAPPGLAPAPAPGPDATGEQALSFLSNIEKQFGELKRLAGESAKRSQELDQRESALRAEADRTRRELAEALERAAAAEKGRDESRQAAAAAQEHAAQVQRDLGEARARLDESLRQGEAHASAVAGLEKQIESLRQQHERAMREQEQRLGQSHQSALREAEQREQEAARQVEMLERAGQTADLARRQAESRIAELEAELSAARAALAQAQSQAAELTQRVESAQGELEQARAQLAEMARQVARAQSASAEAAEQVQRHSEEAAKAIARAEQAERDASASAARLACSAGEHGEALRSAGEEIEGLRKLIDSLRAESGQIAAERDILDAKVKELTAEVEQGRQAQNQAAQAGLASGAEAEKARQTLAQREEALRVLAGRLLNAEERLLAAESDKTSLMHEAAAAQKESADLRAMIESGAGSGGSAPGAPAFHDGAAAGDGFAALRRQRLARYKELLAEQSHKIVQAKAALGKKTEQANESIALRAKLTEQLQLVAAERQRVQKASARSSASVMLLCFFGVMAIVGVLAWAVANQVAPATYAARAVIAADTPGRAPTQDELLAWTASHEKLLEEPDFMTLAAERFGQRGMASLGSPAAVKMRLKGDVSLHADKAGALTIEMRGRGAERTQRELETIALALVAMANSHRDARGDGAATVLVEPPKAGAEPIEDERLVYMAGIGGGGAGIAVVLFLGMYRVVVRSKRKFEQQMLMIENE